MVRTYADYVTSAADLRGELDDRRWRIGDIVCEAVGAGELTARPGSPGDNELPTLSDFARDANIARPSLSAWYRVAEFYPANCRTFDSLTWAHYSDARAHANGDLDNALELLDAAARLHMHPAAFKRWLTGTRFEGPMSRDELPDRVRAMLGARETQVWVTVKRMNDDD